MDIRVATRIEDIGISPEEWNRLLSGSETNTVFQTYEWFRSWWDVFGKENRLFLMSVLGPNGDLMGIAPLMVSKERTLRFASDEKADYCDIICEGRQKPEVARIIMRELVSQKPVWESACLKNIPEGSSTCGLLSGICAENGLRVISNQIPCPTLVIAGREEAGNILRKKTLRRRYNYLDKNGKLDFRNIIDEGEALRCLDIFFDQHMRRRKEAGDESLFADARNREFYRKLAMGLLRKGWLLFSVLEFNGKPIAFHFGFDYGSRVIWYKPSFDVDYSRNSPGQVMLMHLIRYSIENGRAEFDFTLGDEPFKSQFTNLVRMNTQVSIYRRSSDYLFDLSKQYILRAVRKTRAAAK